MNVYIVLKWVHISIYLAVKHRAITGMLIIIRLQSSSKSFLWLIGNLILTLVILFNRSKSVCHWGLQWIMCIYGCCSNICVCKLSQTTWHFKGSSACFSSSTFCIPCIDRVLIEFLNHQAGAVGLVFQASLLTIAVAVYWSGSLSEQSPLLFFLCMIVRIFHFLLFEK